jgi:hypothetical protein
MDCIGKCLEGRKRIKCKRTKGNSKKLKIVVVEKKTGG